MNKNYQALNIHPTSSIEKITDAYFKQLKLNQRTNDTKRIQKLREAFGNIIDSLNSGYFIGKFTHNQIRKGIQCRCGSIFEGITGIIECETCSCFILLEEE